MTEQKLEWLTYMHIYIDMYMSAALNPIVSDYFPFFKFRDTFYCFNKYLSWRFPADWRVERNVDSTETQSIAHINEAVFGVSDGREAVFRGLKA